MSEYFESECVSEGAAITQNTVSVVGILSSPEYLVHAHGIGLSDILPK